MKKRHISPILHRWPAIERLRVGEMVPPGFVDLHLTDVCNHRCHGCAFKDGHTGDYMPEAQFMRAAEVLVEAGVKAFAFCGGGEPFLAPYIGRAMRRLHDLGAYYSTLTNGSLVTPGSAGAEALLDHGSWIRVSLEASNADDYGIYKGVDVSMWSTVISNVASLVQEKRRRGSELDIGIKFAVGAGCRLQTYRLKAADLFETLLDLEHEDQVAPAQFRWAGRDGRIKSQASGRFLH